MRSVEEWLASLGLSEYASQFAEHRIDFSILRDITDQDLKVELGVARVGDRRKSLRAIRELARAASVTGRSRAPPGDCAVRGPSRFDSALSAHGSRGSARNHFDVPDMRGGCRAPLWRLRRAIRR